MYPWREDAPHLCVPRGRGGLVSERQCGRVGGQDSLRASGDEPSEPASLFELGLQSAVPQSRMPSTPSREAVGW